MDAANVLIDIVIALVFFILGQVCPRLTELQRWKDFQAKRRYEKAQQYISPQEGGILQFGRIKIENMKLLYCFPTQETALSRIDVWTKLANNEKPIPKDLLDLEYTYLPQEIERARERGQVLDDNSSYALDCVSSRRDVRKGIRIHFPELVFSPTSYYRFAMINLALDKLLLDRPSGKVSIRTAYGLTPNRIDPEHLDRLPVHLRFGTGTVVVTEDEMTVLSIRSGRQYVYPTHLNDVWTVGVSVGEGMLRPTDSFKEAGEEHPDPFLTVVRGLEKELNLIEGVHFSMLDVRLLALCLDIGKLQPFGAFTLKVPMTFDQIVQRAQFAPDATENKELFPLPFHPRYVHGLLVGEHQLKGKLCYVESNQVRACLCLSLFYYYHARDIARYFG